LRIVIGMHFILTKISTVDELYISNYIEILKRRATWCLYLSLLIVTVVPLVKTMFTRENARSGS